MKSCAKGVVGVALVALVAGCIAVDDRSGDRRTDRENGFWRREGLATWRVVSSPVTLVSAPAAPYRLENVSWLRATAISPSMLVWGGVEMCEELAVGLTEIVCGCQFKSCSYPMERFRFDLEDWQVAPKAPEPPVETARAAPVSEPDEGPVAEELVLVRGACIPPETEASIRVLCRKGRWQEAAAICRVYITKGANDLDRLLNGARLAMINVNCNDRVGAIIAMDTVVAVASQVSERCKATAVRFRNDLRAGTAQASFSAAEVNDLVGLRRELYEAAGAGR